MCNINLVHGCIPIVMLYVIYTFFQITVAFCQIDLQQISKVRAEVGRKPYLSSDNSFVDLNRLFGKDGG